MDPFCGVGVEAVAGVFLLLGMGMLAGVIILIFEHWFYKYALPSLRLKPKGTVWKSRNIMFFSQKLYRFINCVELVSPHHAARELVHSIRQGQIASLFQKSIKRVRTIYNLISIIHEHCLSGPLFVIRLCSRRKMNSDVDARARRNSSR